MEYWSYHIPIYNAYKSLDQVTNFTLLNNGIFLQLAICLQTHYGNLAPIFFIPSLFFGSFQNNCNHSRPIEPPRTLMDIISKNYLIYVEHSITTYKIAYIRDALSC